jgi:ribosomal protein L40E
MNRQFLIRLCIVFMIFSLPFSYLFAKSQSDDFVIQQIQAEKFSEKAKEIHVFFTLPKDAYQGWLPSSKLTLEEEKKLIPSFSLSSPRLSRESTSTVLVIDRSYSIKDSLYQVKEGAKNYIDQLAADDQVSIITVAGQVDYLILDLNGNPTFSTDHTRLKEKIDQIREDKFTSTRLYDSIKAGINLSLITKQKNKAVLVLTDAEPEGEKLSKETTTDLDCITLAKNSSVSVYCIGLGEFLFEKPLTNMSNKTGGKYISAPSADKLKSIYYDLSKTILKTDQYHEIGTIVLLDNSQSISFPDYWSEAKKGVDSFLVNKGADDPVALRTADSSDKASFSSNRSELQSKSNDLALSGSRVKVLDSLFECIQFSKMLPSLRRSIIFVTAENEVEDSSIKTGNQCILEAQKNNLPIYIIARGKPSNEKQLKEIAEKTGGAYYPVMSSAIIPQLLISLSDSFQREYHLVYSSKILPTYWMRTHQVKLVADIGKEEITTRKNFFYVFPNQKNPIILWTSISLFLLLLLLAVVFIAVTTSKKSKEKDIVCPQCGAKLRPLDVQCAKCGYNTINATEGEQTISEQEPTIALSEVVEEKTRIISQKKSSLVWLCVIKGDNKGKSFDIKEDEPTSIGRDSNNDIILPDESVSKSHSKIFLSNGSFFIRDLASSNGTLVNNKQIDQQILEDGDLIVMGEAELIFVQVKGGKG